MSMSYCHPYLTGVRAILVLFGFAFAAVRVASAAVERPNIVVITADDLGLQLSCYGDRNISTPVLDRLAREGVRFTHAYVTQSSCSPSRASLLTGTWPHQNGQVGLSHLGFRMHPGQPTLPKLLREAGYRTGIIGKRHVEPIADVPFDWEEVPEAGFGRTRNMQWVAERSREFFAEAARAGRPFFYYVNYYDPHGPLNETTDVINGLPQRKLTSADIRDPLPFPGSKPEAKRTASARLYNTVLRLDVGVGLLLAELKAAGFEKNTLVVFVGDNGLAVPTGKTTSSELGLRVPLIVRWPSVARAGQVRSELISVLDLMPTLLQAASVSGPAGMEGRPLQSLLRGESVPWREYLFSEMNFHTPDYLRPQRSVRDARHKLLLNLHPHPGEPAAALYDLSSDPWETRNLADEPAQAATRRKLEAALQRWREETKDPLLDGERLQRWIAASKAWATGPRRQRGARAVVDVPPGGLDALK